MIMAQNISHAVQMFTVEIHKTQCGQETQRLICCFIISIYKSYVSVLHHKLRIEDEFDMFQVKAHHRF